MKKPSLLILFLAVFIDLVGFGIVLPLLPIYSKSFGATGPLQSYFDTTVLLGIKSRNVSTPSGVSATFQHGGGAMVGEHGTFTPVIQPRRCNTIYSGER